MWKTSKVSDRRVDSVDESNAHLCFIQNNRDSLKMPTVSHHGYIALNDLPAHLVWPRVRT